MMVMCSGIAKENHAPDLRFRSDMIQHGIVTQHGGFPMRVLHQKGQQNHNARLTDAEAIELVRKINDGAAASDVARDYGITASAARLIFNGIRRPEARKVVAREEKERSRAHSGR